MSYCRHCGEQVVCTQQEPVIISYADKDWRNECKMVFHVGCFMEIAGDNFLAPLFVEMKDRKEKEKLDEYALSSSGQLEELKKMKSQLENYKNQLQNQRQQTAMAPSKSQKDFMGKLFLEDLFKK